MTGRVRTLAEQLEAMRPALAKAFGVEPPPEIHTSRWVPRGQMWTVPMENLFSPIVKIEPSGRCVRESRRVIYVNEDDYRAARDADKETTT